MSPDKKNYVDILDVDISLGGRIGGRSIDDDHVHSVLIALTLAAIN